MKLRVLILTGLSNSVGVNKLRAAGQRRGHDVLHWNVKASDSPPEGPFDIVVPRFGPLSYLDVSKALDIARELNPQALLTLSQKGIAASFDKLLSYKEFINKGIPTPATYHKQLGATFEDLEPKLPLIAKPIIGNRGDGVKLVRTGGELKDALQDESLIIQQFINEAGGKDLRVFVVGGEVVAAMERSSGGGVAANIAQGGTAVPAKLDGLETEAAIKAAKAFGAQIAGVDLLRSAAGPLVLEVNASPGFKISAIVGVDVIEKIFDYFERSYGAQV